MYFVFFSTEVMLALADWYQLPQDICKHPACSGWFTVYCITLRPHYIWSPLREGKMYHLWLWNNRCYPTIWWSAGDGKVRLNKPKCSFWMKNLTIWPHKQKTDSYWKMFHSQFWRILKPCLSLIVHRYLHIYPNATH